MTLVLGGPGSSSLPITYTADLTGAQLIDSQFAGANFFNTDFRSANLNNSDFTTSTLAFANFNFTQLKNANFAGANLHWTTFSFVDLSDVKGLDRVEHTGPCSIDTATIYLSKGKIPESFLRGCGIPDTLISYIPSLVGASDGIQFYSCFISHSGKDAEFVQRLHARMQQQHLRVWYAPEDMKGGQKSLSQIDEAIRVYDKLLLVLSEYSMESDWVKLEIRKTRKQERETGRTMLFPISVVSFAQLRAWECIDSDTGEDLAAEVRTYHIPDFSNWKAHDAFEANFKKLLSDLHASNKQQQLTACK